MHSTPLVRVLFVLTLGAAALPAFAQRGPASNAAPVTNIVRGDAIPPGVKIQAVLDSTLSTDASHPGDRFTASVLSPFYDAQGRTIIPPGAELVGRVVSVDNGEDSTAQPQFTVAIEGLDVRESLVPIAASIVRMRTTSSHPYDRERAQPQVSAGTAIEVELTQPVSILALRHATTERAIGGGPRP